MRKTTPGLAGLALIVSAGLVLAGCSTKTTTTDDATDAGGTAADLTITPMLQIDSTGAEVAVAEGLVAADPAGDGTAICDSTVTISMAGALTGPNAALGINIRNGVQLAIDEHNAANPDCQVQLSATDTEGDPQKATQVIPSMIADENVIALLGPAFSGESKAVMQSLMDAGLLSLTASATNPDLTGQGWTNFFRGLANDAVQGPSVAEYMMNTLGFDSICVVQDDSDYGVGLAEQITTTLGDAANEDCSVKVKTGDKDFTAAVTAISGSDADAVFFAGYYAEAAPLARQLAESDFEGAFVAADGANDPQFVEQAGSAATDAYLSCPCGPAPDEFATAYTEAFDQAPGVYSVEAYDLATIILSGIDSGVSDRAGMIDYVRNYDGQGLARHYKWDANGELASALIWIYQVK